MGRREGSQPPYLKLKRVLDLSGALILLVLFSPLFVLISGLQWLLEGPPIFFVQERPGLNGATFRLLKFRSMRILRSGELIVDESDRITGLGKFLRLTSLDELPQLVNVLRGEMSFVGPRPLLIEYLASYSPAQNDRHMVRPGLTGLAQVRGRKSLSLQEKVRFDLLYVRQISFNLDVWILWKTLLVVFSRRDAL